jgi:hypothetical protein
MRMRFLPCFKALDGETARVVTQTHPLQQARHMSGGVFRKRIVSLQP